MKNRSAKSKGAQTMKVFLTGATGYIGGSVAAKLLAADHRVVGLVRSKEGAASLREVGIEPLLGSFTDRELLTEAARCADAVINAADSDNREVVETILLALEGTGKPFIQTSGTSIVGDKAAGEPSDRVFDANIVCQPVPEKVARVGIDRLIIDAAGRGVRSIVLCNSFIYGQGLLVSRTGKSRKLGNGFTTTRSAPWSRPDSCCSNKCQPS